ncbi:hypothetical protein [Streptomyces sp. NPDC023588]|uniref:hypothetical protein n=1 Tax=Streptomyces sp. NPDC023588 TaxID=3154907 RepID=UPI0033DC872D
MDEAQPPPAAGERPRELTVAPLVPLGGAGAHPCPRRPHRTARAVRAASAVRASRAALEERVHDG